MPHKGLAPIIRSPLLHFLAIGAGLFIIYSWVAPDDEAPGRPGRAIVVPAGSGALFVEDEVLYREAMALGLHAADPIVRRRLIQKMRFLLEDTAPIAEPTEAELAAYLKEHAARFRIDASYDLEHRFFSRDRRRDPGGDARAALARLAGGTPAGDGFAHGDRFRGRTRAQLSRQFGPGFAAAVDALPVGQWSGPVTSSYGVHLVRVERKQPARVPPLTEIRARVRAELVRERRASMVRRAIEAMRARYHIQDSRS